jgi:capsule polysaccharide export protein KpsE/RkpR
MTTTQETSDWLTRNEPMQQLSSLRQQAMQAVSEVASMQHEIARKEAELAGMHSMLAMLVNIRNSRFEQVRVLEKELERDQDQGEADGQSVTGAHSDVVNPFPVP